MHEGGDATIARIVNWNMASGIPNFRAAGEIPPASTIWMSSDMDSNRSISTSNI
jgi:hypothetical protein